MRLSRTGSIALASWCCINTAERIELDFGTEAFLNLRYTVLQKIGQVCRIKELPPGTSSQCLDCENFATARRSPQRVINWRWTLSVINLTVIGRTKSTIYLLLSTFDRQSWPVCHTERPLCSVHRTMRETKRRAGPSATAYTCWGKLLAAENVQVQLHVRTVRSEMACHLILISTLQPLVLTLTMIVFVSRTKTLDKVTDGQCCALQRVTR